jgi:hypothetical protein
MTGLSSFEEPSHYIDSGLDIEEINYLKYLINLLKIKASRKKQKINHDVMQHLRGVRRNMFHLIFGRK